MNAADALVLASHSEGSPNAIKEAMAVNLPVITVDVGDAVDVIGATEGCYVVPRDARSDRRKNFGSVPPRISHARARIDGAALDGKHRQRDCRGLRRGDSREV